MIPIAVPVLGKPEADAAARVVLSGWVSQGPEVAAFENEFAASTGAKYACAVSNCTVALHLALLAAGVRPGDEVITASHTFIATANVVRQCGAVPVFADIDPETYNISPEAIELAITDKTRALLVVHQMGMPCDLDRILAIARRHALPVVEDAACAIGSSLRIGGSWEPVGRPHGDIACFSLHPRKVVTAGEGGVLTTQNPDYDRMFRLWRQHGMSVPDLVRHGSRQVIFEEYTVTGFNYRMTDIQAAVAREQLKRLPQIIETRRRLADEYTVLLADIPGLRLPAEPEWARSNWQSYCVRLPPWAKQAHVMQQMLDRGVATRRGIMCVHLEPAYADHALRLPLLESERARDECILLPLFPNMTEEMQKAAAGALREALSEYRSSPEFRQAGSLSAAPA
jgi:dTDP-4-amino-4,6-dideoxygalactose transaminase